MLGDVGNCISLHTLPPVGGGVDARKLMQKKLQMQSLSRPEVQ